MQLPAAYNLTPAAAYYFTRQTRQVMQLPAAYNLTRQTRQIVKLPAAYNLTPQIRQAVQLSVVLLGVTQQLNEQKEPAEDVLARYLSAANEGGTRPRSL